MKTIRRTRITIREKEIVVVKAAILPGNGSAHTCPLCNSPLNPETENSIECGTEALLGDGSKGSPKTCEKK
jgi:DNA repair exonuclease SbcCD ATPase subunit